MGYNGWTNYETWVTALWMDNEESSYDYWQEQAQEMLANAGVDKVHTIEERAAIDLSDQIKEEHEDIKPELQGVFADLLNAAMSEINWYEIAQRQIEDLESD